MNEDLNDLILSWEYRNYLGLVDYLESVWVWKSAIKKEWIKGELSLELHTGGWGFHEELIELLKQTMFFRVFHYKWLRGGHYYFKINPRSLGFLPVSEFAALKGVSRQYIHKTSGRYEWITVGKRNQMVRDFK